MMPTRELYRNRLLSNHHNISELKFRPKVEGEIKPVSVSQSATFNNDEAKHGAGNAIDMDMDTQAYALSGAYTNAWFKAKFDEEYCIERVILYWWPDYSKNLYTCSPDNCSCEGGQCSRWTLSVYRQYGTVPGPDLPSGCKVGDTVKIQTIRASDSLDVDDLVIISNLELGELRYSITAFHIFLRSFFSRQSLINKHAGSKNWV